METNPGVATSPDARPRHRQVERRRTCQQEQPGEQGDRNLPRRVDLTETVQLAPAIMPVAPA